MNAIENVLYLPTLRCNLNCIHCGQSRDLLKQTDELDCSLVFAALENSCMLRTRKIGVSGGEPFLNETLVNAICAAMESTSLSFEITTNGYFRERLCSLAESIRPEDRNRLAFNVSIDGTEEMHNRIRGNDASYRNAVKSARMLLKNGFSVNVQYVVQKDNVEHIEEIETTFHEQLSGAHIGLLPLVVECSKSKESFPYEVLWKYVSTPRDKLRLLSKGIYGLRGNALNREREGVTPCHAGLKNITIGPDGRIYTCLTGAYYKCGSQQERQRYCLGNLEEHTLDEIWIENGGDCLLPGVKQCTGCANLCEVDREIDLFGKRCDLEQPEMIRAALDVERDCRIGDAVLNYESWYYVERDNDRSWCWSRESAARIFIESESVVCELSIRCRKLTADQRVKLILDGREVNGDCSGMECDFHTTVNTVREKEIHTLLLVSDRLRSPKEAGLGDDDRQMGVCLTKCNVRAAVGER